MAGRSTGARRQSLFPAGVIEPTEMIPLNMNQTLPSGPAHTLPAAEGGLNGYSVNVAAQPQLGSANTTDRKSKNKSARKNFIKDFLSTIRTDAARGKRT